MAQLVARLVRNEKVRGSNPLSSTSGDTSALCRGITALSFGIRTREGWRGEVANAG